MLLEAESGGGKTRLLVEFALRGAQQGAWILRGQGLDQAAHSPFQLLTATILSAQCTDERVNMVTPHLFKKYPTPAALAESAQEDVETIIQSIGFFRAKSTNIRGMARQLVERHNGEVPQTLDELIQLPGVGRKKK